jgi:hypothetical protein
MKLLTWSMVMLCAAAGLAQAQEATNYLVLATTKTSTMQKEMQDAAAAGFKFAAVMGGETSFGGNEVVVLMQKSPAGQRFEYRLLATNKTSTLQKELQDAADAGFEFVGQTVFESLFGGKEVAAILERAAQTAATVNWEYKLIATKRTSTLQKELQEIGDQGFEALGMTVGQTAVGGAELVVIMRRKAR